jgi:hypothetical protein
MEKEKIANSQLYFESLGLDSKDSTIAVNLVVMFTNGIIGDINILSNPISLKSVYILIRDNIEDIEMKFGKFNYLYSSIGILCNLTYSQINSVYLMFSILLNYPSIKETDLQIFKTGFQIIVDNKLKKFATRFVREKGLLFAYKMVSQKVIRDI